MNRGIYDRGRLPHWDFVGSLQAITFRLADSVPSKLIEKWNRELRKHLDDNAAARERHRMISRYEDLGHGSGVLRRPECAEIVQEQLFKGHPDSYRLIEWCVMPNHVHVMVKFASGMDLASIIRGWKGPSARLINELLGTSGTLWQREYHDRLVRDLEHYYDCRAYIRNNPVKAGLCDRPEDWPFSAAGTGWNPDEAIDDDAPCDGVTPSVGESANQTHAG